MIVRFAKLPFVYIRMTVTQSGELNSAGLGVKRFEFCQTPLNPSLNVFVEPVGTGSKVAPLIAQAPH